MANIRVTCPACKSVLEIDRKFEGEQIECGTCLEVFKAERPKTDKYDPDDPKIVVMVLPGAVPRKRGCGPPPKAKRRRDEDEDDYDDDDYAPPPSRRRSSTGGVPLASVILGAMSLPLSCCCLGWVLSVPLGFAAVVTGLIGLRSPDGKPLATLGILMGLVSFGIPLYLLFGGAAPVVPVQWFR